MKKILKNHPLSNTIKLQSSSNSFHTIFHKPTQTKEILNQLKNNLFFDPIGTRRLYCQCRIYDIGPYFESSCRISLSRSTPPFYEIDTRKLNYSEAVFRWRVFYYTFLFIYLRNTRYFHPRRSPYVYGAFMTRVWSKNLVLYIHISSTSSVWSVPLCFFVCRTLKKWLHFCEREYGANFPSIFWFTFSFPRKKLIHDSSKGPKIHIMARTSHLDPSWYSLEWQTSSEKLVRDSSQGYGIMGRK